MVDDIDPVAWSRRQRLKNALRVLCAGIVIAAIGGWRQYSTLDAQRAHVRAAILRDQNIAHADDMARHVAVARAGGGDKRVVAGGITVVGGALVMAGLVMLVLARRQPKPGDQ